MMVQTSLDTFTGHLQINYEWALGFKPRFGLIEIDYKTKELYWRPSAFIYKEIAKTNSIPDKIMNLNRIPPLNGLKH